MTWTRQLRPAQYSRRRSVPGAVLAAFVVCFGMIFVAPVAPAKAAPTPTTTPSMSRHYTAAGCASQRRATWARCYAEVFTPGTEHRLRPQVDGPPDGALGPAQIQSAYRLSGGGGGQTVAIVDAYGYSEAEHDLEVFRSHYGLTACTKDNSCLRQVNQGGGAKLPSDDAGWDLETALDLDAVSSACPSCNILLVEANDPSFASLGAAVDTAVRLGAKYVSNSYGEDNEEADEVGYDPHYDHRGVAVVVASGDHGNVQSWPSTNPDVISVGGTQLTRDGSTTRGWSETTWSSGGSGCSLYEPRPDYQLSINTSCPSHRATADISADAAPESGLAVYDTSGQTGWLQIGGTSLATPLTTAMYAVSGPPSTDVYPVASLYDPTRRNQYFDITTGTNSTCGTIICTAGPGWDGPTGLGTPDGVGAFRQGPHGTISGTVLNASTGAAVSGATVTASNGNETRTDGAGHYALSALDAGKYSVTVNAYGYATKTRTQITVTNQVVTMINFTAVPVPSSTISGTVTDGTSHHWPLYAEISIDGYPLDHTMTNPVTGKYAVSLPRGSTFTFHVAPVYDGYTTVKRSLTVTAHGQVVNFAPPINAAACAAPGYGFNGTGTDFTGWTGTAARDAWTVGVPSGHERWHFDNPGNRVTPTGGDGTFAVADSAVTSSTVHTSLTSPRIDLTGQTHPKVTFDSRYIGATGQVGAVYVAKRGVWHRVWHATTGISTRKQSVSLDSVANIRNVRVRFTLTAHRGGYWAIDNPFIGSRTCIAHAGGLITGNVRDSTARRAIPGTMITLATRSRYPVTTIGVPDDPDASGAFYWLFARTGKASLRATRPGYRPASKTLTIKANHLTNQNWTLIPS